MLLDFYWNCWELYSPLAYVLFFYGRFIYFPVVFFRAFLFQFCMREIEWNNKIFHEKYSCSIFIFITIVAVFEWKAANSHFSCREVGENLSLLFGHKDLVWVFFYFINYLSHINSPPSFVLLATFIHISRFKILTTVGVIYTKESHPSNTQL